VRDAQRRLAGSKPNDGDHESTIRQRWTESTKDAFVRDVSRRGANWEGDPPLVPAAVGR
jgi:hypothetical protein